MNKDILEILLADNDSICHALFHEALKDNRIKTTLTCLNDSNELFEYLEKIENIPDIVFLELTSLKQCISVLSEIRHNSRLKNISIAVYSALGSEKQKEEVLVHGANIFFRKTFDLKTLRMILEQICNLHWQYETSGLRKENFILSLNRLRVPPLTGN